MGENNMINVTVRITSDKHKELAETAKNENRSISNLVNTILLEWMSRKGSQNAK